MGVTSVLLSEKDKADLLSQISEDEKRLIDDIMAGKREIIIYGARALGEAFAKYFISRGIRICCFCDRNITFQEDGLLGYQVLPVERAVKLGHPIVICSIICLDEMIKQLESLNFKHFLPFYSFFYNAEIHFSDLQKNVWLYEQIIVSLNKIRLLRKKSDSLVMDSVAIMVTERCTLRCKDCIARIPELKNPKDESLEDQLKALEKLLLAVDYIGTLQITGGEALLHPNLVKFMSTLIKNYGNRFSYISVVTNGTIIPSEEFIHTFAREPKVFLQISDYGPVSNYLQEIIKKLDDNALLYCLINYNRLFWKKRPTFHPRECGMDFPDVLKKIYEGCELRCPTLTKGRYYNCGITPTALARGEIAPAVDDGIDLLDKSTTDMEFTQKLRKYISQKYTETCGCCSQMYYSTADRIPAGVQL